MGSIADRLKKHRLVALDTCIWIYHFQQHSEYSSAVGQILTAIARGQCAAISSELALFELITGPLKLGRQDVADEYEALLTHFPNLALVPVTRAILLDSALIRAQHGFKAADAIVLATAKAHGATLAITNDRNWAKFPDVATLCLDSLG